MNWEWLFLYVGYAYYVYRRATLVAKSSSNRMSGRLAWILRNRAALIIHGLGTGALYLFLLDAPGMIGQFFGIPNFSLPKALFHPITLPLLGFFACAIIDSQLEKYPRFKSEVPQIRDEPTVAVSSYKEPEK